VDLSLKVRTQSKDTKVSKHFHFSIFPCLILVAVRHSILSNHFRFLLLPSYIVVFLFKIAINPSSNLLVQNGYLLINNIIALSGYYICAMIIDKPKIGRKNVQTLFFILVSVVFLIMSFLFQSLSSGLLISLYFLSSFLGQFVVSSLLSSTSQPELYTNSHVIALRISFSVSILTARTRLHMW
jgi:hypothetical protein